MAEKPKYYVVAAVVVDGGEILCVQKPQTKYAYTSFRWEYPGGKVEKGETESEAIVRELREEMDYPVIVDSPLCEVDYEYPDFAVNLHFWRCHPASNTSPRSFVLKEHAASCWIKPAELHTLDWCAADCILPCLFLNQDLAYRDFNSHLLPTVDKSSIIGVRTPVLRSMARHIFRNRPDVMSTFLQADSHHYFEQMQLHAFILSEYKDFDDCITLLDHFLPFVNNWATCDQLSPRCFKKQAASPALRSHVMRWLTSSYPYAVRFGIATAMRYYLQDNFDESLLLDIMKYRPAEHFDSEQDIYYLRMMQAWYVATALSFCFDRAFAHISASLMEATTQKMAVRKAIESFRIPSAHKEILRGVSR